MAPPLLLRLTQWETPLPLPPPLAQPLKPQPLLTCPLLILFPLPTPLPPGCQEISQVTSGRPRPCSKARHSSPLPTGSNPSSPGRPARPPRPCTAVYRHRSPPPHCAHPFPWHSSTATSANPSLHCPSFPPSGLAQPWLPPPPPWPGTVSGCRGPGCLESPRSPASRPPGPQHPHSHLRAPARLSVPQASLRVCRVGPWPRSGRMAGIQRPRAVW